MKICNKDGCNNPRFGGGFCKWHQGYRTDKKPKELNSKTLSSEKDTSSPVKKRKPIKPISDKMAGRLKEYRVLRDKYLKDHPECARCGTTRNQTLQHLQGREGDLLTDVNNFMTLCVPCHQWATEFTNDAIEQGFARYRNKKSGN